MEYNEKSNMKNDTNIVNIINDVEYIYYDYIDITLCDPISAISLTNKYVVIGTMSGAIKLYYFEEKRIYIISKNNIEHISGLFFSVKDHSLYASVGDIHYLKYEMREPFMDNSMPFSKIDLYDSNLRHNYCCDNSYVLMSPYSILKVNIFQPELEEKILNDVYIDYDITFLNKSINSYTNQKIEGKIKSTNYYVPLDYDGNNFCWVEYKNDKQDRELCIQNIMSENIYKVIDNQFSVNKDYGHISHAKLLKGNKILIVHDLNKCAIYEINEQFERLENFTHIGDEVYAVDVVYGYNVLSKSYDKNNKTNNLSKIPNNSSDEDSGSGNKVKVSESQRLKVRDKKLKSSKSEHNIDSISFIKYNLESNKKEENNLSYAVVTLDIDGNVNKYEYGREEKLFNLYEINGIHQDFKDKKFFDMGYMYYIKTNLDFFCITTDHGCFIIKKK